MEITSDVDIVRTRTSIQNHPLFGELTQVLNYVQASGGFQARPEIGPEPVIAEEALSLVTPEHRSRVTDRMKPFYEEIARIMQQAAQIRPVLKGEAQRHMWMLDHTKTVLCLEHLVDTLAADGQVGSEIHGAGSQGPALSTKSETKAAQGDSDEASDVPASGKVLTVEQTSGTKRESPKIDEGRSEEASDGTQVQKKASSSLLSPAQRRALCAKINKISFFISDPSNAVKYIEKAKTIGSATSLNPDTPSRHTFALPRSYSFDQVSTIRSIRRDGGGFGFGLSFGSESSLASGTRLGVRTPTPDLGLAHAWGEDVLSDRASSLRYPFSPLTDDTASNHSGSLYYAGKLNEAKGRTALSFQDTGSGLTRSRTLPIANSSVFQDIPLESPLMNRTRSASQRWIEPPREKRISLDRSLRRIDEMPITTSYALHASSAQSSFDRKGLESDSSDVRRLGIDMTESRAITVLDEFQHKIPAPFSGEFQTGSEHEDHLQRFQPRSNQVHSQTLGSTTALTRQLSKDSLADQSQPLFVPKSQFLPREADLILPQNETSGAYSSLKSPTSLGREGFTKRYVSSQGPKPLSIPAYPPSYGSSGPAPTTTVGTSVQQDIHLAHPAYSGLQYIGGQHAISASFTPGGGAEGNPPGSDLSDQDSEGKGWQARVREYGREFKERLPRQPPRSDWSRSYDTTRMVPPSATVASNQRSLSYSLPPPWRPPTPSSATTRGTERPSKHSDAGPYLPFIGLQPLTLQTTSISATPEPHAETYPGTDAGATGFSRLPTLSLDTQAPPPLASPTPVKFAIAAAAAAAAAAASTAGAVAGSGTETGIIGGYPNMGSLAGLRGIGNRDEPFKPQSSLLPSAQGRYLAEGSNPNNLIPFSAQLDNQSFDSFETQFQLGSAGQQFGADGKSLSSAQSKGAPRRQSLRSASKQKTAAEPLQAADTTQTDLIAAVMAATSGSRETAPVVKMPRRRSSRKSSLRPETQNGSERQSTLLGTSSGLQTGYVVPALPSASQTAHALTQQPLSQMQGSHDTNAYQAAPGESQYLSHPPPSELSAQTSRLPLLFSSSALNAYAYEQDSSAYPYVTQMQRTQDMNWIDFQPPQALPGTAGPSMASNSGTSGRGGNSRSKGHGQLMNSGAATAAVGACGPSAGTSGGPTALSPSIANVFQVSANALTNHAGSGSSSGASRSSRSKRPIGRTLSAQRAMEAAERARALARERLQRGQSTAGNRSLPNESLEILRSWLYDHFDHPYPTEEDKEMLAQQTKLTKSQVNYWMINARVRIWKPIITATRKRGSHDE